MESCAELYEELFRAGFEDVAQYAIPMAYRLRFCMQMNAREAVHIIELRTSPQGHRNYRSVCSEMLRLIRNQAGHRGIAEAMVFAREDADGLERLDALRRSEERQRSLLAGAPLRVS